jgi:hypothetical protein
MPLNTDNKTAADIFESFDDSVGSRRHHAQIFAGTLARIDDGSC